MLKAKIKVLVVDDEPRNILLIKEILGRLDSYVVDDAVDGEGALKKLKDKTYDALLTDWLMPKMNGAELIKRVRSELASPPFIIMITAIQSSQAKESILEIGADEYISKPLRMKDLLVALEEGLARKSQPLPKIRKIQVPKKVVTPPFMAVVIASSTGGYDALTHLFSGHLPDNVAFFLVHHSPEQTLRNMAKKLKELTNLNIDLARDSQKINPGHVYIAPANRHLCINPKPLTIRLNKDPKENYVRPSADPLFRSAALVFGKYTLGVVLTGLGVDGTNGAAHIKAAGGEVLVQDPESAIAPTMPKSVILSGLTTDVVGLTKINSKIKSKILRLTSKLIK
jgi:two-component system, chemotaxis family, protein-glutamate methylesterase/glutaminase